MVVVAMRRRWPALAGAGIVYVILLLPTLGFFAVGAQPVADRYSYLHVSAGPSRRARRGVAVGGLARRAGWRGRELSPFSCSSRCNRFKAGGTRSPSGAAPSPSSRTIDSRGSSRRRLCDGGPHAGSYRPVSSGARALAGQGATIRSARMALRKQRPCREGLPLLLEALRLEPERANACLNAREAVRLLNLPPPPELEACRPPA